MRNTRVNKKTLTIEKLGRRMLGAYIILSNKQHITRDTDYKNFDGTKLPYMSGLNFYDAVFNYLSGDDTDKITAVEKYIDNNVLIDDKSVEEFFKEYLEKIM